MIPRDTTQTHNTLRVRLIIFDLDGVLVRTSRSSIGARMFRDHPFALLSHVIQRKELTSQIFSLMHDMLPAPEESEPHTYDPEGHRLPYIMHKWLIGAAGYDSDSIQDMISAYMHKIGISRNERRALEAVTRGIFDPEIRSRYTHIHSAGYRVLCSLQDMYPEHTYAILSNYDTECFDAIYAHRRMQRMFQRFHPDNIHLSGYMQMAKPDPRIYYAICDYHGVAPAECLLIDDQIINVEAARNIGMHGVCFGHDDISDIEDILKE